MKIGFITLWTNHPGYTRPCNFDNQCAIRMGVALEKSGIDLSSFKGARCWHNHTPRHILRAQELATWMSKKEEIFGKKEEFKNVTYEDFQGKHGIVFIQDGWGPTDHIDLWNGVRCIMKAGGSDYFAKGKAVWFWELSLFGGDLARSNIFIY